MAKFSNLAIPAAPSQVALEPMELESVECMCAISSVATKTGAFLSKWSFASPTFKDLKHPGRSPLIAMFTAEPIAAGSRVTVGVGSPATVSGHKSTKDGVVYENWQFAPGWELTAADADFRLMTDMPVVSVASIATK